MFKTHLPSKIEEIHEAKSFLKELYRNNESFHPEDDAHCIEWSLEEEDKPTAEQCDKLNSLMSDIYELPEVKAKTFDPCDFLLLMHNGETEVN